MGVWEGGGGGLVWGSEFEGGGVDQMVESSLGDGGEVLLKLEKKEGPRQRGGGA